MFRWTRRIISCLSFLLFTFSLALWGRSYVVDDWLHRAHVARLDQTLVWDERSAINSRGQVSLMAKHAVANLPHPDWREQDIAAPGRGWVHDRSGGPGFVPDYHGITPTTLGFGRKTFSVKTTMDSVQGWVVVFPWWAPVLVFAVLPARGVIQNRRRLRRAATPNLNGMTTARQAA